MAVPDFRAMRTDIANAKRAGSDMERSVSMFDVSGLA